MVNLRKKKVQLSGAFADLRKVTINFIMCACLSVCLSVCLCVCVSVRPSAWHNPAPIARIFMKVHIGRFRRSVDRIQILLKSGTNKGILHTDLFTFVKTYLLILLRMRNFRTKVGHKIKIHILCSKLSSENRATYEIIWKNTVKSRQATDDNMHQTRHGKDAVCILDSSDKNTDTVL
jgi:hypothetical protein